MLKLSEFKVIFLITLMLKDYLKRVIKNKIKYSEIVKYDKDSIFEYIILDTKVYDEKYNYAIKEIGEKLFFKDENLTEFVIPDGVISIGGWSFCHCKSLTKIIIPNSVTSIGDYAFESCKSLKEIVIPNSVISIDEGAFGCCINLKEIVIPDSVTSIDKYAFCNCTNLKKSSYTQ